MNLIGRKTAMFLGIGVLLVAAGVGSILAGDPVESRGKMTWIEVGEDGTTHQETIEFEGPRPFLGVRVERAPDGGVRIDSIVEDSAAAQAGLLEGDVIVGYGGQSIETPRDLTRAVLKSTPGDRVELEIEREGDRRTVHAEIGAREGRVGALGLGDGDFDFDFDFDFGELGERLREHGELGEEHLERLEEMLERHEMHFDPERLEERMEHLRESLGNMRFHFEGPDVRFRFGGRPRLGVALVEVTGELREHLGAGPDEGVLVGRVLPDTPAEAAGIEVGDLIVAIGGETVADHGDLRRELGGRDGETILVDVIRDGRPLSLTVSLPEREEDEGIGPSRQLQRHPPRTRSEST